MKSEQFSRFCLHPWHGVSVGEKAPEVVTTYIEISPLAPIKYELDKESGLLRLDRMQKTASVPPAHYGFIPQTYCGARSAALTEGATEGDGDPLDVCLLSEFPIVPGALVDCRVIGVVRLIDGGEADDKIIGVVNGDPFFANVKDISDLPAVMVDRLEHYFTYYKAYKDKPVTMKIESILGKQAAYESIKAAQADYATLVG